MSWLTLLPLWLMGAGTWLAPAVLRRLGARPAMVLALLLIGLGCALRLAGAQPGVLLATAALCGAGVALAQGMLPGLIKLHSPRRVAPMMGVYSAALMGGGALGAQLSPLALQWGASWQGALAIWAWPVLPALALAWLQLRAVQATAPATGPGEGDSAWLLRRRRTWLLMLLFGLMNGGYGSMIAWLAPHYQALGWSAARSGWLVAVLSLAQIAAALSLPILGAARLDRRLGLWFTLTCQLVGFATLAAWPLAAPVTTAVVLGIGLGGCFALIMLVALDHLHDPMQAGALNALMQGGGFMLAALAPWAVASLHQISGDFATGWWMHVAAVLVVMALVAPLAPRGYAAAIRTPSG